MCVHVTVYSYFYYDTIVCAVCILYTHSTHDVNVCVRACVRACVHACVRACMRACVRACMRACMHACVRVCVNVCVCVHVCVSVFEIFCVLCIIHYVYDRCECLCVHVTVHIISTIIHSPT